MTEYRIAKSKALNEVIEAKELYLKLKQRTRSDIPMYKTDLYHCHWFDKWLDYLQLRNRFLDEFENS